MLKFKGCAYREIGDWDAAIACLRESCDALEAEGSEVLRKSLGDHVFTNLIESKKIEWDKFRTHVTNFELDTYLAVL